MKYYNHLRNMSVHESKLKYALTKIAINLYIIYKNDLTEIRYIFSASMYNIKICKKYLKISLYHISREIKMYTMLVA